MRGPIFIAISFLVVASASAELRIVDYNTAGGPRAGLDTILEAIGNETVNGIQRPIDVLALQEQSSSATTTAGIVDVLNGIYGDGTYDRATIDGGTLGAGRPGLVYNTQTIELIDETAFGVLGSTANARQTLRYWLRPFEYDTDLFIYNSHYKASTGGSNEARRNAEATAIRNDADSLGNPNILYVGDFNIRTSSEPMYQTLLGDGNGQAFDPIDSPGDWNNANQFQAIHTQSPSDGTVSGLTGGGVDDRFDFQLMSGELFDGVGLDYLDGSYRVFGNNGTHGLNNAINSTSNTAQPMQVLDALATVSDHLPVVVDLEFVSGFAAIDLNRDGIADVADLDLLFKRRDVDMIELGEWLRSAATENGLAGPYLLGDANLDGSVDAQDLNPLGLNWQSDVGTWSGGDFNDDGIVNSQDLGLVGINWQQSVAIAAPVPESSTYAFVRFVALIGFLILRRQISKLAIDGMLL